MKNRHRRGEEMGKEKIFKPFSKRYFKNIPFFLYIVRTKKLQGAKRMNNFNQLPKKLQD